MLLLASLLLLYTSPLHRLRWLRGDRDRDRDPLDCERETVKWYRRRGEQDPEPDEEPDEEPER